MHLPGRKPSKLQLIALQNRQDLIRAGLHRRRDLFKLGLLTSAGYLVAKPGLSSADDDDGRVASPPTRAFIEPLPIMPTKQPVSSLSPAPTVDPNTAAGESRTRPHQALAQFPPRKLYRTVQQSISVRMSPDLPLQQLWGFDGMS